MDGVGNNNNYPSFEVASNEMNFHSTNNDQLENLSNLIINNSNNNANGNLYDEDNVILEQYERDLDKGLNDNLFNEKDQCYQRLFQSFQTSACTVAQMFKDKASSPNANEAVALQQATTTPQLTPWQSFQNSAGAITVLYKDSLEACRVHYELGVAVGQQRKLKDIINWLKKKRRRTIRKDEIISFLIGKPVSFTNSNSSNHLSSIFSTGSTAVSSASSSSNSTFNTNSSSANSTSNTSNSYLNQSQPTPNVFLGGKHQLFRPSHQLATTSVTNNSVSNLQNAHSATCPNFTSLNQNINGTSTNANLASNLVTGDTSSDLATFREALIMHNRSRDAPIPHSHLQNYTNHHYHQHSANSNHHHFYNAANQQNQAQTCDDLDCFFCEQIATHIEHKRTSSAMNNFDMESPTRKRSRFY